MQDAIKITLPYPPKELSPNGGKRWFFQKVNRLKNECQLIAKMAANYSKPRGHKPWKEAETQIVFFRVRRGKIDQDNAINWCKAFFDGIALAGIIENDVGLTHKPVLFEVDKENPHVEITLTKVA